MNNITDQVVKKGLCSGCGICAGLAEKCNLTMKFSKYGELMPVVTKCNNCGLCFSMCFSQQVEAHKQSNISSPLGKYIECFVGYSRIGNERANGSSGGLVTRVSKALLEKKLVNGVIVVGKSIKEDRIFEPIIARTPQEIDDCTGSKYYPIEFSSILKRLKQENGKYAIVGLPCVINGLRLVQKKYPAIGNKIKYLLGLVCGHNKNKNYTSFLIKTAGVNDKDVETVLFRCKQNTKKSTNYGFKTILKNRKVAKQLNFQDSLVKDAWCKRYFSLNACFYCHDLFAAQADISFMDAWLKPYMDNPLGTSIVVVRNDEIKRIIEEEKNKSDLEVNTISEIDVLSSQRGALDFKQQAIIKKKKYLFNKHLSDICYYEKAKFKFIGRAILKTHMSISRFYEKLIRI